MQASKIKTGEVYAIASRNYARLEDARTGYEARVQKIDVDRKQASAAGTLRSGYGVGGKLVEVVVTSVPQSWGDKSLVGQTRTVPAKLVMRPADVQREIDEARRAMQVARQNRQAEERAKNKLYNEQLAEQSKALTALGIKHHVIGLRPSGEQPGNRPGNIVLGTEGAAEILQKLGGE